MNGQKKQDGNLVTKKVSIVLLPNYKLMEPKDRILIKAEELFMQFGIRSVSMDDIANNLGMSKKTLYQYFADMMNWWKRWLTGISTKWKETV